jgi:tetratricopeptide (TPR) repeat protein
VRIRFLIPVLTVLTALSLAQDSPVKPASNPPSANKSAPDNPSPSKATDQAAAPGSEADASSSLDTRIDISPPKDDDKTHPSSKAVVAGLAASDDVDAHTNEVQEFHPWNPLKATKDNQVGDFYYKRGNYKAALERYKEALYFKEGDAVATFRIGQCQEKLGNKAEAKKYYQQYLKILPEGPEAKNARASVERLASVQ